MSNEKRLFDSDFSAGGISASDWLRWRDEDPTTVRELIEELLNSDPELASAHHDRSALTSKRLATHQFDFNPRQIYFEALSGALARAGRFADAERAAQEAGHAATGTTIYVSFDGIDAGPQQEIPVQPAIEGPMANDSVTTITLGEDQFTIVQSVA